MKITVLGSGTSIPHPRRASPGLVVELAGTPVLVDPSSGSLHRAERAGIPVKEICHVLFSHYHPDHTGDLVPLLFALQNPDYFAGKKLWLVGPPGLVDLYRGLVDLFGRWVRLEQERIQLREVQDEVVDLPGGRVRAIPVRHTQYSVGYRFSDNRGKIFAYSGDTDYCPGVVELARDADLALIEAAQPSERRTEGHLTPTLAGRVAREADARHLVITHLYPICDDYDLLEEIRLSGFSGPAEIARDGMALTL